jgi:hypothetical protein
MPGSLVRDMHINDLPSEILSLIFTTTVGWCRYARVIGDKTYGSIDCPTVLASVCARWRRVAIGIPKLWSYVDFTRKNNSLERLEHVNLYFQRSQNSPLRIHIGKFYKEYDENRPTPFTDDLPTHADEQVVSLLRANAPRLQSLAFNYGHPGFVTDALSILLSLGTEHSLQELALRRDHGLYGNRRLLAPEQLNQLLKPLRALYLEKVSFDLSSVNCGNLVELHMVYPTIDPTTTQLFHFLSSNPHLRLIKFGGMRCHAPASPDAQVLHLPSLCSLELDHVNETLANWLLQILVPGPQELDLRLHCSSLTRLDEPTVRNALVSFLRRAPVKSLCFPGGWISLSPILTHLPHLQQLGLSVYDVTPSTFEGVEHTASALVKLHTIDLIECRFEDDSILDPGLRVLLTLPSLRRIRHIGCGQVFNPESQNRFRELISGDGISAQVSESPELHTELSPFR